MNDQQRAEMEMLAKQRIKNAYSWEFIADEYKKLWLDQE